MRRLNPTTIALIAAGAILLILIVWLFVRTGNEDQDRLTGAETTEVAGDNPEERCASARTYDLIKRELFRRAAQLRGSDQAAFDQLSAYASVRMERPVLEREDPDRSIVYCSGSLWLDLPPNVAVVGGRRTLNSDIDYALQPAADRSGDVLTLSSADAIITPLATLARAAAPRPEPSDDDTLDPADPAYDGPGDAPPAEVEPAPAPPPPSIEPGPTQPAPSASARPSYDCANASTRSERAVCADSGLASLDRQMAAQFNSAMAGASRAEREMLERSRTRFLNYRDRCRSDACIADAYRGRMAEIRDIMAGRWQPPR